MIAEIKALEDHALAWLSRPKFRPTGALLDAVNKITNWCLDVRIQIALANVNKNSFWTNAINGKNDTH